MGSSCVLEGPLVHLVSVETHVGTAERSRRSSWCTSEKSIECFFWTSAAVREYFHRERTPQRKVRSSSSSLCLDYVDEGVPHLHASHSGGGRGSFIDFCEPQTCRSASFACFAALVLLQKRSPQYFREVHNILHQSLIQARAGVGQPPRGGAAVCLSFHPACLRPAAAEGVVWLILVVNHVSVLLVLCE